MMTTHFPSNVEMPTHDNAEIGYVRAISGNDLTITRAQEGSLLKSVAAGWQIIGGVTAKTLPDVEEAIGPASCLAWASSDVSSVTMESS